jgi:hypothetical protein
MRMTAIHAQTERKRQDRFVRHAEKRRRRAVTLLVRGPIRKARGVCANTDTAQGEKRLFNWQIQANVTSSGRPLGECRGISADWLNAEGMSCVCRIYRPNRVFNKKKERNEQAT